jgi:hypothetical protein
MSLHSAIVGYLSSKCDKFIIPIFTHNHFEWFRVIYSLQSCGFMQSLDILHALLKDYKTRQALRSLTPDPFQNVELYLAAKSK